MARILAVDYGTRRTGLAVTDPLQITVNGLETVHTSELIEYLQNYLSQEKVELIVVGEPLHADGTPTQLMAHIKGFIRNMERQFPDVPVVLHDESYTSSEARSVIMESGAKKKKRQDRGLIDKVAAVLILQDYLAHRS